MDVVYDPRTRQMVDRQTGLPVGGNYQPPQRVNALEQFFNGTGIPARVGVANSLFNPVVGLQEAGQHSVNMLAPGREWTQRVSDAGQMLTGMAGTVAPMWAASRGAMPAANALVDGLTGWTPTGAPQFMADEFGGVLAPAIGDPVAARGAQIMDMLRSGRAKKVTDEMLDMGNPTLNARLSEYLYRNYDLPMDEASRMARAKTLGFDADAYHGGADDLTSARNQSTMWFGDDLAANSYAADRGHGGGGNVMPVQLKGPISSNQNLIDTAKLHAEYDPYTGSYQYLDENQWPTNEVTNIRTDLMDQGFTGAHIPDDYSMDDNFNEISSIGMIVPSAIRSKFARFDPRLAHLKNLSAGMAGLAATLGISEEEMKRMTAGQK